MKEGFDMNKLKIKENALISNFSYHDGRIIDLKKDGSDYVLSFIDGWLDNQINEIRMVNAEVYNKYELKDRIIYQFGFVDFCEFDEKCCFLEFFVWYDDCLTEVVKFRADEFVCKTYVDRILKKEENFSELFINKKSI